VYLKKDVEKYLARMGLWRVSDWWLHLMLHLDTKATNYFMY